MAEPQWHYTHKPARQQPGTEAKLGQIVTRAFEIIRVSSSIRSLIRFAAWGFGLAGVISYFVATESHDIHPLIEVIWRICGLIAIIAFAFDSYFSIQRERDARDLVRKLDQAKQDAVKAKANSAQLEFRVVEAEQRAQESDQRLKFRTDEADKAIAAAKAEVEANRRMSANLNEQSQRRAAEAAAAISSANQQAELNRQARIELEQRLAKPAPAVGSRRISPSHQSDMINILGRFAGQKITINSVMGDGDSGVLAGDLFSIVQKAGWNCNIASTPWSPNTVGVLVYVNPSADHPQKMPAGVPALVDLIDQLGLSVAKSTVHWDSRVKMGEIGVTIGIKPNAVPQPAVPPSAPQPTGFANLLGNSFRV